MFAWKTKIKTQVHTGPLLLLAKKPKKNPQKSNNNPSTHKREWLWGGVKKEHSQFNTQGVSPATC